MSGKQLGTVAMVGVLPWVIAVISLHFLDSELNAADNYVSDYALGEYGWPMRAAFIVVGFAAIAIGWGLRATLAPGKRVTASVVFVCLAGIGFVLTGIFNTDPTGDTDLTAAGTGHVPSALVLFLCVIFSAWTLRGVFKRDKAWEPLSTTALVFAIALTLRFLV